MKKILIVVGFLFIALTTYAQDNKDSVDYRHYEQRINSLPYYSYGKGLGFTSPDSLYQMNIRFRIQPRASLIENNDGEEVIDGQIRRLRLRFDGYVGNPRFTYAIQLSFTPGDLGGPVTEGKNINIIRDAVIFYNINKRWAIGFGQTKLPGNRQRVNSSGALQLTDRTINNAMFNIDRDFGIQSNYINKKLNEFSYAFKGAISQGEGRNITENTDTHLAYTGKFELYPMGSFKNSGEYFEGDVLHEEKPKLMFSSAYQFNNKGKNNSGQFGEKLFQQKNMHSIFVDAIFKYRGFGLVSAYMQRYSKDPIAYANSEPTSEFNYVIAGRGYDLQSSYIIGKNYELIGRYSKQMMQKQISKYRPDGDQYTIGLTKYIWEHAFKIQGEATYNKLKYYDNTAKNNWYVRFQIEMGI